MTNVPRPAVAALLHGLSWNPDDAPLELDEGVTLGPIAGTPVEALYWRLCSELAIDDGEPFQYQVYANFTPQDSTEYLLDFGDPYSKVDRLCNIIAVIIGEPVSMCRAIWSRHGFLESDGTSLVFTSVGQSEFLTKGTWPDVSGATAESIASAWQNHQRIWNKTRAQGRLANALVYFYYAWRAHYIEQCCINLAIALEILFSPHHQGETVHQIAYYTAAFVASSRAEIERVYRTVKRFYSVRSQAVHGGLPADKKVIDITVEAVALVSEVLSQMLGQPDFLDVLEDQTMRREWLDDRLFGGPLYLEPRG